MDRKLIQYLPEFMRDYKEIQQIMEVEQKEVGFLWDSTKKLLNEAFVNEESEMGASRWEKILYIVPKDTDNLLVRNFRIHGRLVEALPYTYRVLESTLKALCGENGYHIDSNYDKFVITIKVALTVKKLRQEIEALCERMIPLNLFIEVELMYNTHELLQPFTHQQLANSTHQQLRDEPLKR